ncbi:MAG: M56 family metallopeptidase [Bacteroidaceae bacterium]|nr:M56 family metallopeptidase [Bacteroidaceae bacterium]
MNILFTTETTLGTALLTYQFKVALILVCFYLCYRVLMSKETFHKLNRCLLTSMLMVSFILPFCVFTIHRYIPEEAVAAMTVNEQGKINTSMPVSVPDFRSQLENMQASEMVAQTEAQTVEPVVREAAPVVEKKPARVINWWLVALFVWFTGCVFHLSRTMLSVLQVRRLIRTGCKVSSEDNVHIYVVDMSISPFSWMNNIVLSREDYESDNRSVIIDHEMTHVRLGHSYDLMMVDLLSAMQWFNPVTMMLRKDLQDVHEFQVDGCVLRDGFDAKEYQYMLLGKIASLSGYSVTNHFKKQNLSNRINMMNRKDSKFARAFKALYAPLLTGLVIISFAVTVYDCKPEPSQVSNGGKRNVDVLRDSMQILDEIYGQGKFNRFPWETGAVWLTEGDTVIVRTGDRHEAVMKPEEVADYLLDYQGFSTHRITIVLSRLEGDQTETGLQRARPLVDMLNEVGIYTLVVKTDREWFEAYYSTYKYGRIYTWEKGIYELDYNGLTVHGTPKQLADWIKALDIEYMAFYPDEVMPWADASVMMKAAYERGSRTFSICVYEPRGNKSTLADLLDEEKDKGVLARENKAEGYYRTTVLPVKRNLDKEFKGKTVMDVERRIRGEYTDDYIAKAKKVVDNPPVFNGNSVYKVVFCEDELVIIKRSTGLGRNVWYRPDVQEFNEERIIADGKVYKFIREEGFQNFSDYPWHEEYNYANGSFFWVPDNGYLYCATVYEAVPEDVKFFDIVDYDSKTNTQSYISRGVNISKDPHLFDEIQVIYAGCLIDFDLPGTAGPNQVAVQRIERTLDGTEIYLQALVRADFSYPAYFGSDLKLTLNDGTEVKIQSASVPLNEDFDRGGDHMITTAKLVFPKVDLDKLLPDMENKRYSKLTGTVFHRDLEMNLDQMAVASR